MSEAQESKAPSEPALDIMRPEQSLTKVRMQVLGTQDPEEFKALVCTEVRFNWEGLHKATKLGDIHLRYHRKFKSLLGMPAREFFASQAEGLGLELMSGPNNGTYILPARAWDQVKDQIFHSTQDDPLTDYSERYALLQARYFGKVW